MYYPSSVYSSYFLNKEPRRILLGHVSKRRRVGTGYNEVLVNEEFAYVPLLQSLDQMLNQPTVLTQVIQQASHNKNVNRNCYFVKFCFLHVKRPNPILELEKTQYSLQVLNVHKSTDGYIRDFCDGQLYKCHPLFSRNPQAIQIILYYDELEIANPLGSKAGKHKLGNYLLLDVTKYKQCTTSQVDYIRRGLQLSNLDFVWKPIGTARNPSWNTEYIPK